MSSCLSCMSMSPRSSSRDTSPAEAKAPADTYQVAACSGRGGVGSEEAPAGPGDSLVRRALTDIPTQAENGQGDTDTQPSAVRRTVTDLPPFVSDDPTMERRLARSIVSPISVKFTNELADRNGLARWKKTALAVTGARRLSHVRGGPLLQRSDSRIAGTMARQQEMERVQLDDGLDGFDDGVHLLEKRLKKMGLRTLRMGDDGNCQFRALSFNLFGSEDHHQAGGGDSNWTEEPPHRWHPSCNAAKSAPALHPSCNAAKSAPALCFLSFSQAM